MFPFRTNILSRLIREDQLQRENGDVAIDTQKLRNEHSAILRLVSRLGGLSHDVKLRDDAERARALILDIDDLLRDHLAREDADLYPAMMGAADPRTRALGSSAADEMGSLVGVWIDYRDHWTVATILGGARRFAAVTEGVIGALSLRIEMENDVLYPAMDRLDAGAARDAA